MIEILGYGIGAALGLYCAIELVNWLERRKERKREASRALREDLGRNEHADPLRQFEELMAAQGPAWTTTPEQMLSEVLGGVGTSRRILSTQRGGFEPPDDDDPYA